MHIQHSPDHGADEHERCPKIVNADIEVLQIAQTVSKKCKVVKQTAGSFGLFGSISHLLLRIS